MNKQTPKAKHGGARPGAGRPSENKTTLNLTIDKDVVEAFKKKHPRKVSPVVEQMMRQSLAHTQ